MPACRRPIVNGVSHWDEQFAQHAIAQSLDEARASYDKAEQELGDADQREAHGRVGRVLDFVEATLKAADPELVPMAVLDQVATDLTQLATYLQNFFDAPEQPVYLDNANAQADAILTQLPSLAARVTSEDVQEVQSAVSTFRRSVGQHLRNIESDVDGLRVAAKAVKTALDEQEAKIEAQDTRLDNVVTQFQEQFSTAQATRQTDFSQALEEGRTELRASISESKETLSTAVADAQAELEELLEKAQTASDEALATAKGEADAQHATLAAQGEKRIKQLDELLAKAVKTVGVIGSTGMAGGYQIVANDERKAANIWRRVAAVALLGAIGATIFAVAHGLAEGFEAATFFAKWAASLPFAALAAYAAHESSKHREEARVNRQIELQLASLDAYLVTLPEEKQEDIRGKLADRFFGELRPGAAAEDVADV